MTDSKIKSANSIDLNILDQRFTKIAKIIFLEIKQQCPDFTLELKRSVATLLTALDTNKYKNSSISEIEKRAKTYVHNISKFTNNQTIENNLNTWILLLTAALGEQNEDFEFITNTNYIDINEIILEAFIYEIERSLIEENSPILIKILRKEIFKLCKQNGKVNFDSMNLFFRNKDQIINQIKNVTKEKIKIRTLSSHLFHFLENSSFQKMLYKAIVTKTLKPFSLNIAKSMGLAKLFPAAFSVIKNIPLNQFNKNETKSRVNKKKILKAEKSNNKLSGANMLFSMLHSHNPKEYNKIPSAIANNCDFKREAKRLVKLGLSPSNAAIEGNENVKNFREKISSPSQNLDKSKSKTL